MPSSCKAMIHTPTGEIRQCNNKPRHSQDTCRVHKHFFRKDIWISKVLYGRAPFLSLRSKNSSSVFHANHICETIQSGRVILNKEDVKAIPQSDQYIDIFRLLCSFNCIHPVWNIRLLVKAVVHYVWLIAQGIPTNGYLDSIVNNENLSGLTAVRILLPYWSKVPKVRPILHIIFEDFLEHHSKTKSISLYSNKYILDVLTEDNLPDTKEYVSDLLLPIIVKNRKQNKKIYRDRLDAIKEELMMKMWAPERIEAYQEKYGIFLLDDLDEWLMATATGPRV